MGRTRYEITDQIIRQVESLAAQGLSQEQIALSLGWSADTVGRRKKDTADFADALKRGKAKGIATITNKLFEQAKSGNLGAIIYYLKCQGGEVWNEKNRLDVSNSDGSMAPKGLGHFYAELDDRADT
jgi:hypothetical protein